VLKEHSAIKAKPENVVRSLLEKITGRPMHGTDVHGLTPDGQLIVTRVIESPRHRADVRLVLQRVPE
jgi:hypothetical protein